MAKTFVLGICVLTILTGSVLPVLADENWVFGNTQPQVRTNYGYSSYPSQNYVPVQIRNNDREIPDIIKRQMKYEESRNTGDRMLPVKRGSKKPMC